MYFMIQNQNPKISDLISARKSCRKCLDWHPGKIHSGVACDFDPNVISYWSQWLGNTSPEILIIGQDFGDIDYFRKFRSKDDPASETNANLYKLLIHIGLTPKRPPQEDIETQVYLTNSILCLKEPPMNSPLRDLWVRTCAQHHLLPLAQILKPSIVVAMGKSAWLAARTAFNIKDAPKQIGAAAGSVWQTQFCNHIFPVGHCSGLGIRNRPWQVQLNDWSRIGEALRTIRSFPTSV